MTVCTYPDTHIKYEILSQRCTLCVLHGKLIRTTQVWNLTEIRATIQMRCACFDYILFVLRSFLSCSLRLLSLNYHRNGRQWQWLCQEEEAKNHRGNIWIMLINMIWYCGRKKRASSQKSERKKKKKIHSSCSSGGSGGTGCALI